jgi:hypothetical protein
LAGRDGEEPVSGELRTFLIATSCERESAQLVFNNWLRRFHSTGWIARLNPEPTSPRMPQQRHQV